MSATSDLVSVSLAAQAQRRGGHQAYAFPFEDRALTYRDWFARALRLARGFNALGLAPTERVSLLAENRIEWPVVQAGAAIAGLVLVPLNTHYRREDLAYALRRSSSKALVTSRSFRENAFLSLALDVKGDCPELEHLICLDGGGDDGGVRSLEEIEALGEASSADLPTIEPADPCAVIFTSGTTGTPKGALLSHRGVMRDGLGMLSRIGVSQEDRVTSIVPMFHSASYCATLPGCLQLGATFLSLRAFDALEMMRLIHEHAATVHISVPTSLKAMFAHPRRHEFNLSSLRTGTCGGADVDPEFLAKVAVELPLPGLVQAYGLTEASAIVACPEPDDPDRFRTAGHSLKGFSLRAVDVETRKEVPAGTVGEIEVAGEALMLGYLDDPASTAATFAADGWLKTGDLGRFEPSGKLVPVGGRLKDMIIRGGENIYPAEIELVLARHPGVQGVSVFGLKDDYLGEIVAAAIKGDAGLTFAEIQQFCFERMAKFKSPSKLFRLDIFPLTPSGKVKKPALRDMAAAGQLEIMD